MHQILVVFENDSKKSVQIAKHVYEVARARGDACALYDLRHAVAVDLRTQDAVLVVAPISRARQRASVARFVRPRSARLSAMPSAFVSIGPDAPGKYTGAVSGVVRALLDRAGWSPTVIAQLDVGREGGRLVRGARVIIETLSLAVVRRGPAFEVEPRADWRAVDDALERVLDAADEVFAVPTARQPRVSESQSRSFS